MTHTTITRKITRVFWYIKGQETSCPHVLHEKVYLGSFLLFQAAHICVHPYFGIFFYLFSRKIKSSTAYP